MKKNLMLIVMILSIVTSYFTAKAQVDFGIKGGVTGATQTIKNGSTSNDHIKFRTSVDLGVIADIPLANSIFIEPGFFYWGKGSRILSSSEYAIDILSNASGGGGVRGTVNRFSYLEIPLNFLYKLPLGNNAYLLGYAGPYLSYLLSAKAKHGDTKLDLKKDINPLDAGVDIGGGVQMRNIRIGAQLGIGLMNVDKASESDTKIKNLSFSLSVAYMLGKN